MDFEIMNGPWSIVFQGKIEGHSSEIYSNNKNLFMSLVYDEKDNKKQGALIQFFKVFYAKGMLEEFIETLPKNVLSMNIHFKDKTFKFFILTTQSAYALYDKSDMLKETNELMKALETTTKIIFDVSKVYDLKFTALDKTKKEEKQVFYSMPLISLLLYPVMKVSSVEAVKEVKPKALGEIILGKSKAEQLIKEPFNLFFKTIILQGKKEDRIHAMNILMESAMLSGIPVIGIEAENEFSNLSYPSDKRKDLEEFGITLEPMGFPVKEFTAGKEFKASLALIEPETIIEEFGLGNTPAANKIKETMEKEKTENIDELIKHMKNLTTDDEFNAFQKRKSIRILNLIEKIYPGFFNNSIDVNELMKLWHKGLGRTNIIKVSELDERQKLFFVYSLIKAINEKLDNENKAMLFIPEITELVSKTKKSLIKEKIKEELITASKKDLGFAFTAKTELDLPKEFIEEITARMNIVSGNDVGIIIKGLKQYRIILRPCLSKAK